MRSGSSALPPGDEVRDAPMAADLGPEHLSEDVKYQCGVGLDQTRPPHVLLVDDNTICQKVGRSSLHKLGCECDTAGNGKIALQMVGRAPRRSSLGSPPGPRAVPPLAAPVGSEPGARGRLARVGGGARQQGTREHCLCASRRRSPVRGGCHDCSTEAGGPLGIGWDCHGPLDQVAAHPELFDIIIMDLRMPVMDGLEATRRIRQDLQSNIPILAFTAETAVGVRDQCREAGCDGFLNKPAGVEELAAAIQQQLPTMPLNTKYLNKAKKARADENK